MEVRANLFIILASLIFPVTLIITYSISVYNRHIITIWPYISHTGDEPTESCFFSFGLNLVSALYALIVFLRYSQVKDYLPRRRRKLNKKLNLYSLVWGMISSFFLSMTCSFQQRTTSFVHIASAVICSYTALVYFWHQTFFCYVCFKWITRRVRIFRTVLSSLSSFIHCLAPCLCLYAQVSHPLPDSKMTQWSNDTEAMGIYLAGSFMEWSVFVFNELYISSFYWEFRNIKVQIGDIQFEKQEVM